VVVLRPQTRIMASDPSNGSAEKTPTLDPMSPAKRKRLQQCFEHANELVNKPKPDRDYAHDLYAQPVANDPGNLVYVEAALENLQKKFNNNKKGSRFNFGGRKAFKEAVGEEDWPNVFRQGLELLKSNPWDTTTLRELAKACAYNHYNEVELRYLKNALDGKPKDLDVNRHCAQSLARMGQFDMAIACWNRVADKVKGDEADRMISELTLAKTMGIPASVEAFGSTGPRPVVPPAAAEQEEVSDDLNQTEPAEKLRGEIRLNKRQTLEKAIREDPTDGSNYLDLAELHSAEIRYQDAERVLGKAIEAVGASLKLQTAYENAQIRSAKARVAIAEQRAANSKTDATKELVGKLRSDLNRLELDVYQNRCLRYPKNLRLRYDLGVRLRRAGNYLEAIKSYDVARKDPNCLVAAALEMGECWQQMKQYSKALKCYQAAIRQCTELDGDRQKMSLYRGAVLAAALKQTDQAKEWFRKLLELDGQFKDAAARLDKLG